MADDQTIKAEAVGDTVRLNIQISTGACAVTLSVTDALLLID
jgi:hypothetical protein